MAHNNFQSPSPNFLSIFRPSTESKSKSLRSLYDDLFKMPTAVEVRGAWELCRLHANIGFWVVWIPVALSLTMAYHHYQEISFMTPLSRALLYVPLCFGIKSLIMTIDDILDSDVDGLVERTRNRAIPRGAISLPRAWLFFAAQVVLGVYCATKVLSPIALKTSMAVWPLYVLYPTCKRWMDFAPIPLGLMFQVGAIMGWADISANLDGSVPWSVLLPLYIGASLWTVTYETVYQHQDSVDDVAIGLRSLALRMDTLTIPFCTLTGFGFFGLLTYAAVLNGQSVPFFVSEAVAFALLFGRLWRTDIRKPADCKALFLDTPMIGQILLAGLVTDVVMQRVSAGVPL